MVSHKAHTTRERILGVLTDGDHQLVRKWNQGLNVLFMLDQKVFLDTPGVVPDNRHARMNRTLVTSSWRSLDEADHGKWMMCAFVLYSLHGTSYIIGGWIMGIVNGEAEGG